ncbi:stage II sporulation protein M [Carboxydocella sp. ULO1]|uniref:stage II sporulation protein M n=1 Tax=Carboxydocella sp. ULO1 TaxID=1926599 RepID=UPI0009AEF1C0|nr:stage II sporulation protein M [Carboxydocella sp. ULO1]
MVDRLRTLISCCYPELLFAFFIYGAGGIIGVVLSSEIAAEPSRFVPLQRFDPYYEAYPIIKNNLKGIIYLISGLLSFGVSTAIILVYNGVTLGDGIVASLQVMPASDVFLRLVPHGLIEIAGIMLGSAAGFQSLICLLASLRGKEVKLDIYLRKFCGLLFLSISLIVLAGFIEAYITVIFINQG